MHRERAEHDPRHHASVPRPACARMHRRSRRGHRPAARQSRARGCADAPFVRAVYEVKATVSPARARMHRNRRCRGSRTRRQSRVRADAGRTVARVTHSPPRADGPFTPSRLILACEDSHAPLSCAVGPILESVPRATPIHARTRRARMVPTWAGTRTCRWTKTSGYPDGPSALIVVVLPTPAPPARMSRC